MSMFGSKNYTVDDLEEGIREKIAVLPARTPPTREDISELVGRSIHSLVEEHQELLDRAKTCFAQVEACLKAATEARASMLTSRKESLGNE